MKRVVITSGDPAGIGPEVIEKALKFEGYGKDVELVVLGGKWSGELGHPDESSARVALQALEDAVAMLRSGEAQAVVTGPICKESMKRVGFEYPGQTEYFADAFAVAKFGMLLTGRQLTVGLATIHEALADVPGLLTVERIVDAGVLVADFLRKRGRSNPRIAVAGLNPHSGEGGHFGREEIERIGPAIEQLQAMGIGEFIGPGVPDSIFREAAAGRFDAVVAMYHDQGLIPLKLLDFDTAVNVTMGLPIVRTSPDHGTAFGIAGKGLADERSMIHAIQLACELA